MSPSQEIEVQDIDHLGIIAGIVDEIGIVEIIDGLLGTHAQEQVSPGQVVKALILNCMGFLTAPMYLFSEFFQGKAIEHLIGPGVNPAHLNDTRIGRVLDKLYDYGVSAVFVTIAIAVVQKFGIALKSAHLDSTSMSVEGEYRDNPKAESAAEEEPMAEGIRLNFSASEGNESIDLSEEPKAVKLTYGYSRDHRSDLKQFVIDLMVSADGDIPLFFQVGDGNGTDNSTFVEVISAFQHQWSQTPPQVIVADAALYSRDNLVTLGTTPWISRVPASLSQAQFLLQTLSPELFVPSVLKSYTLAEVCSTYGGIPQRWVVVESEARKDADLKQLQKSIDKAFETQTSALNTLQHHPFACEADALNAATAFEKTLKYHTLSQTHIEAKPHYQKAGRPTQNATPSGYTYHVRATLVVDEVAVAKLRRQAGRFILATNLLDEQTWSNDDILREYKEQQSCERGFRFIKDPLFFASSVFLKTPRRIMALAMLMGLCLMVYSLGQRQLRRTLQQAQAMLPNQKGKPTAQPTLRWILQCFQAVHLVWLDGKKCLICLNDRQRLILPFLGAACQKYYFLC